jgi:hypothetical protein
VIPFVGRTREVRKVTDALTAGRNVILVGPYGIGRTALIQQVAQLLRRQKRFVMVDFSGTPGEASDALVRALDPGRPYAPKKHPTRHKLRRQRIAKVASRRSDTTLVMEDMARFTEPMYRFVRFLTYETDLLLIAVVERCLPKDDLLVLRRCLCPSTTIRLGPLNRSDSINLLRHCSLRHALGWTDDAIRMTAAITFGRPSLMFEYVRRATRGRACAPEADSRPLRKVQP